ncbi:hypothetical protein M405DRAFT_858821, partial [Rhizopogon salebrosus TDB-379]
MPSFDYEIRIWNTTAWQQYDSDAKVLATGGDNNAYIWDVSATLALRTTDNAILADATQRPVQRLRNGQRLPPRFFDTPPDHPAVCRYYLIELCLTSVFSVLWATSPAPLLRTSTSDCLGPSPTWTHILFLIIDNSSHKAPASVRLEGLFFDAALRRNDESIAWQERRPTIVDVPHAQGQRRNASAREVRSKREKEKNAKKASAGGSQLPQCSVTQQSGAAPQTQPSSQSNAAVSILSTTPALAATSAAAASLPEITIRLAVHWTRFWLRF